jgi:DNA-binding beta-propeller fold protein YncE
VQHMPWKVFSAGVAALAIVITGTLYATGAFRSDSAPGGGGTQAAAKTGADAAPTAATGRSAGPKLPLPNGSFHRELGTFRTGSNPKQVAFSPDGKEIWVSLLGGKGVQVFSTATRKQLAHIKLGKNGAVEVIFTRDGRTVYASQMETASVWEIDRQTRKVRRTMRTGGKWSKVMALSGDERTLYVANWSSDDVSELDVASGKLRRRMPTVDTPRGLYATPDGKHLWVAGFRDGDLARIDLATGKGTTVLRTGGAMRHLVGDGRRLYADDMAKGFAWVVDLPNGKPRRLARTDRVPNTMDLTPDGKVLYVSNRGRNGATYYRPGPEWGSVLAIHTATGNPLDAIIGGNQTTGLDVSSDGKLLAFSDFLDNTVHVYALPDYRTLTTGKGGRYKAHLKELRKRKGR